MLSMSSRSNTMYYQIVRSSAIDWYLTIIEGKLYELCGVDGACANTTIVRANNTSQALNASKR